VYSLSLGVDIPDSSRIDKEYLESPLATLAIFEGHNSDVDAPEWTRMLSPGRSLLFRQPRGAMAEVFSVLAVWQENQVVVSNLIVV
jgi:hypothetical protein